MSLVICFTSIGLLNKLTPFYFFVGNRIANLSGEFLVLPRPGFEGFFNECGREISRLFAILIGFSAFGLKKLGKKNFFDLVYGDTDGLRIEILAVFERNYTDLIFFMP